MLVFVIPHPSIFSISSITFCACYANNVWNAQSFPFLSQALFNGNGTLYDQLSILDDNYRFDPVKLEAVVSSIRAFFSCYLLLTCLFRVSLGFLRLRLSPESD